jgi:hypothetical protein
MLSRSPGLLPSGRAMDLTRTAAWRLEHVPKKLFGFFYQDMRQLFDFPAITIGDSLCYGRKEIL